MWASPHGRSGRPRSAGIKEILEERSNQNTRRARILEGATPRSWTPFYALLVIALVAGSALALPRGVGALHWPTACRILGGAPVGQKICVPQDVGEEEDGGAS